MIKVKFPYNKVELVTKKILIWRNSFNRITYFFQHYYIGTIFFSNIFFLTRLSTSIKISNLSMINKHFFLYRRRKKEKKLCIIYPFASILELKYCIKINHFAYLQCLILIEYIVHVQVYNYV